MTYNLAKRRSFHVPGYGDVETPKLVLSFSSKGFSDVGFVLKTAESLIADEMLISAYDYANDLKRHDDINYKAPDYVIMDSGGYETSAYAELSDPYQYENQEIKWSPEDHKQALTEWAKLGIPTVAVSYDHDSRRFSIADQIENASKLFAEFLQFAKEILLKPKSSDAEYLHLDDIKPHISKLDQFDIIGITEKEMGNSYRDKLRFLACFRRELDKKGVDKPIHVFGSLDPISTPMYFIAGADIFDGLTWLRYLYSNGQAQYKQISLAVAESNLSIKTNQIGSKVMSSNHSYLLKLHEEMSSFLREYDFARFEHNADVLKRAHEIVLEFLGD